MTNKFSYSKLIIMDRIESQARALELAIARRIRRHRKQLQWTLDDLSTVTGLSKGHLSQIENGEKIPPIGTMTKIAFGLGTSIGTLINGEAVQSYSSRIAIGKKDQRMPIVHTEASPKSLYESFGFLKPDRIMDTYVVTMGPEYPPKAMIHVGQEFVYTLEGIQEFYYDGRTYTLNPGDAVYFESDRPHMGRSLSKEPATVLVVYCNPSQSL